jgi:iron-sulfur cluster assembly accessory protein
MRKSVVTFSQAAVQQLANLASQHRTPHLRLYVKGGGCNGLQYGIEPVSIEDAPSTQLDTTVAVEGNLSVHVCHKSLLFLIGTHVDWKTDAMGQGFQFQNPNAKHQCGCGSTFSV